MYLFVFKKQLSCWLSVLVQSNFSRSEVLLRLALTVNENPFFFT